MGHVRIIETTRFKFVFAPGARPILSATKPDLVQAAELYTDFREELPRRSKSFHISKPKASINAGEVKSIDYDTTHAGKAKLYQHRFVKGSRPTLLTDRRFHRFYLTGGRYHVTYRGIVDLDVQRREIEDGRRRK